MKNDNVQHNHDEARRKFLFRGGVIMAGASIAGLSVFSTSCDNRPKTALSPVEEEEEERIQISANEDLMREHGLHERLLLIYDWAIGLLNNNRAFDPTFIHDTATIIQDFTENYHEKLEEEFVFPRFKKEGREGDLVTVLIQQHDAGRKLTELILQLTRLEVLPTGDDLVNLLGSLKAYVDMYRHHISREETVLFPAFRKVVSTTEYAAIGEEFEIRENQKFGEDGFSNMVNKVAEIEKQLGIYDLSLFTAVV